MNVSTFKPFFVSEFGTGMDASTTCAYTLIAITEAARLTSIFFTMNLSFNSD
jgi:hypothetical protein